MPLGRSWDYDQPPPTVLRGQSPFDRLIRPDMNPTPEPPQPQRGGGLNRQRLLAMLAAGLSQPNQGGGFFGGLASGFSGAVGGGLGYDRQKHEEYRQQQRDEREQRRFELYEKDVNSRVADRSAPPGSGSPTGNEALLRMTPEQFNELVLRRGKIAEATRTPARVRGVAPQPKPKAGPKPAKVKPGQAYSLGGEKMEAEHISLIEQMKTDTRADAIGSIANNASLPGAVRAAAMKRLQELGAK